tara:strand:- start:784 stop:1245 length:462 start_codon:yes stop_codon:yes gene_type:complete
MNADKLLPSIVFQATNGLNAKLEDYRGQWLILYFYPKDSTPGCTTEGQEFRDLYETFKAHHAEIFGISRDSLKSHENFKAKQQFPFELISDQDETLCQLFDVIKQKNMFGKQVRGIERSTFIINPQGEIVESYRKVKVKGHAALVLEKLKSIQ